MSPRYIDLRKPITPRPADTPAVRLALSRELLRLWETYPNHRVLVVDFWKRMLDGEFWDLVLSPTTKGE